MSIPHGSHFQGQRIISEQVGAGELQYIWQSLEAVLDADIPGDIVEFGCYIGTTSLFIRRLLDQKGQSHTRAFHVYDSFAGLPAKTQQDISPAGTHFTAGELSVGKKDFLQQFRAAHLTPPLVHKAWFDELRPTDIPGTIAFAYLDGDFYESILTSLSWVWPRLSPGGMVLIDDYNREALPGPERAVRHFFKDKAQPNIRVMHEIARVTR